MRIFTLLMAATATLGVSAATPARTPVKASSFARIAQKAAPAPGDLQVIYDTPEGELEVLNRDCDAFTVEAWEASHAKSYGSAVRMVTTAEGDIYFGNIVSEYPVQSWVKATREGNTVTIEGPQAIYEEYDWDYEESYTIYLMPLKLVIDENQQGTYVAGDDVKYVFNVNEDGSLVSADPTMLLGVCTYGMAYDSEVEDYVWSGYGDRDITISKMTATPVTPPADAEIQKWVWKDPYETTLVNVATSGTDIYVAGMDRGLLASWVKGTIEGDKVNFASGQYLGMDEEIMYFSFFCGAEFSDVEDPESGESVRHASLADQAVFDYDAANKVLTSVNGYVINGSAKELYPLYAYEDVTIEYQQRNPDTAPAAPYDLEYMADDWGKRVWMQIPNTDTEGKLLDVNNLYYQVIIDGTPVEFDIVSGDDYVTTDRLPYAYQDYSDIFVDGTDHTVYFYQDPAVSVSVRSVYVNEEGKELYSEAATHYMDSSVEGIGSDKEVESEEWYDTAGRRIQAPATGIVIRTIRYTDGTRRTLKVVR